ncbi:hypothetical protein CcCBS67573_g03848 [Chytriomyces confervae]|uniref:VWFA domain-containing protein n=1 Tax=Chytriomyces confervae TaxID=246404 RepID=A0A507FGY2_9FUNG|nr:hypothetical protein HDU80_006486 [Chytriomyces hyalinus]TPX74875.1 hypothetical protein CcCBS67573_g03848 [Chytriomyces confervae]
MNAAANNAPSEQVMDRASKLADISTASFEQQRSRRFASLIHKHQISEFMAAKLAQLEGMDIAILCDDSDSMQALCQESVLKAFPRRKTRWSELTHTVGIIADLSTVLDSDGVDVFFCNRDPILGITSHSAELDAAFATPPEGDASLNRTLNSIIARHSKKHAAQPKSLLIIIATDGEPGPDINTEILEKTIRFGRASPSKIYITFVLCNHDPEKTSYLHEWDHDMEAVDVVDDFWSEQERILSVQGPGFDFSKGDWVCKLLLGSVDRELDVVDEEKLVVNHVFAGY